MKKLPAVFIISTSLLSAIVLIGMFAPSFLGTITASIQSYITDYFGWYYLIVVTCFLLVCFYLFLTPVGRIKLGKNDDKPDFSRGSWLAMLYSAGMGIGLVFYGAAEPISHFAINSPTNQEGTAQGIKDALRFTFFHWGFHAWAVYAIVGLVIGYFMFRKKEPAVISATLKPVLGDKVYGKTGTIINVLAILSTVFGVATTLGFGALQINGGLSYLFDIPVSFSIQLVIILIVSVLFILSAVSGLGKGIKILSNTNMVLAFSLLLLVFFIGPSLSNLNLLTDSIGSYLHNLPRMSFRMAPLNPEGRQWINDWTIFYWAWWIAWSPFVGIFIARISKGRTIREFVLNVLLVPSIMSFIWFTIFGGTAIQVEIEGTSVSKLNLEQLLFGVFDQLPLGTVISFIAILLVIIFFITSADSGTFVLGMMSTNGLQNPPNQVKVIWGVMLSAIALVLLNSGGLIGLQNAMIIAALPFSIIMILMTISLFISLNKEVNQLMKKM